MSWDLRTEKINVARPVFFKKIVQIRPKMLKMTVFETSDINCMKSGRQTWGTLKLRLYTFILDIKLYGYDRKYCILRSKSSKYTLDLKKEENTRLFSFSCASPVFLQLWFSNCTASFIVGAEIAFEIIFEIVIATFKKYYRAVVPRVSIIAVALT